jgi:hypothetical protein
MHNSIEHIDINRLEQIDIEREITMSDPQFRQWCKDMRIGIMYTEREGISNANSMMAQWNNEVDSGLPEWIRRMY